MDFREIIFGNSSAEEESASYPDLLLKGYLDYQGITKEAVEGSRFLILGYKGSGKSSLSEHLSLSAESRHDLFVKRLVLSDFSFGTFKKIVGGDADPETKYPTAWSWLLLIQFANLFSTDEGAESNQDPDYLLAISSLKKLGLLPVGEIRDLVLTSSKQAFKLKIPPVFETALENMPAHGQDQIYFNVVEHLRKTLSKFITTSKHILIIDGLDEILTGKEVQYQSLFALISEAQRLNQCFRKAGTSAKIIVLCRTDLFERLPGPNKNKLRQDSSIELDWYSDPADPDGSNLSNLINLRAKLKYKDVNDVFKVFFPNKLLDGSPLSACLNHTRHTPRDLVQLLNYIKMSCSSGKVSNSDFMRGLRQYSIKYFLPEIRDELVGYVPENIVNDAINVMGSLGKRDFNFDEFIIRSASVSSHSRDEYIKLFDALFECSAIGHVQRRPGGNNYFSFKFRNRNAAFNIENRIILHRGIWKAMNLV